MSNCLNVVAQTHTARQTGTQADNAKTLPILLFEEIIVLSDIADIMQTAIEISFWPFFTNSPKSLHTFVDPPWKVIVKNVYTVHRNLRFFRKCAFWANYRKISEIQIQFQILTRSLVNSDQRIFPRLETT